MVRIRLQDILLPEPVSAGMNPYVLMSLTYMFRSGNEDTEPVTVNPEGDYFRIVDGRHRVVASIMAGRKDVLAILDTESVPMID